MIEENKKLVITERDISRIKDYAFRAFEEYRAFSTLDQKEIQCILIIEGLHHHLESNGLDPQFNVHIKGKKHE